MKTVVPPEPMDRGEALARVSIDGVRAASGRLAGVIEKTPVIRCGAIDAMAGAEVCLKCESMQPIGAFKIRGAYNAMSLLSDEARAKGVLAYSSGNHAQAVAMAGGLLGVRTVILMPSDAPRVKLAATRARIDAASGSRVEVYDPKLHRREALAEEIAEREGLTVVPPYDHPDIICGQGTAALALCERTVLDYLFVPTGGGGLLAGCATVAKATSVLRECKVIGVEPALADDAARSFRSGSIEVAGPDAGKTICDGARTPYLGAWTFPVIRERVDGIITATDAEVSRAMRVMMEKARLVVEPTGALGLAGAMKMRDEIAGKTVGVIVSGGNVDLDEIPRLLAIGDQT
ncbi:MAG: pyridoxal-phosphate dependent enzyme [Phycisphaerales bacterium]|nr:pyridoxal-phosphate dependent enzyme [Phycisphaerales bacterium]